jgi:hypothetical protein
MVHQRQKDVVHDRNTLFGIKKPRLTKVTKVTKVDHSLKPAQTKH